MRLHRFMGNYDLSKKEIFIEDYQHIKQIKDVLRLKKDDHLMLSDGKGSEAETKIVELTKNKISLLLLNKKESTKSQNLTSLYLAILKKENFELAVQKSVEVGVSNIIPIITDRTIKIGLNTARIEKIIIEASEQCGQNTIPKLFPIMNFEEALNHGKDAKEKIIFNPGGNVYKKDSEKTESSIFVGPEGGFTEREIKLAQKFDYKEMSLGDLILRGETAAIIATYLVSSKD